MDSVFKNELCCIVCFEQYDEKELRPRLLSCGHSFCTSCIQKILSNSCSCPTCSKVILNNKIESIPIVYDLKNMVQIPCSPELPDLGESNKRSERKVHSLSKVKLYEGHLSTKIKELQKICKTNQNEERIIAEQISFYQKQKEINKQLLRDVNLKNVVISRCKLKISEFEDTIGRQKDIILNMTSINELNNFEKELNDVNLAMKELEFQFFEGTYSIIHQPEIPNLFSRPTKEDIYQAASKDERVFASLCRDNLYLYGQISIHRGLLFLHCLNENLSSSVCSCFSLNDCLLTFNDDVCLPQMAFMEISVNDEICGVVIFETNFESEAELFIRICCGIDRVSFKGNEWDRGSPGIWARTTNVPISPLFALGKKNYASSSVPFMTARNLSNNDDEPNVLQLESMFKKAQTFDPRNDRKGMREGDLVGMFVLADDQVKKFSEDAPVFDKFGVKVWLKDVDEPSNQKCIGSVIEGLNILKKADNMVKEGRTTGSRVRITISDCGIVLK